MFGMISKVNKASTKPENNLDLALSKDNNNSNNTNDALTKNSDSKQTPTNASITNTKHNNLFDSHSLQPAQTVFFVQSKSTSETRQQLQQSFHALQELQKMHPIHEATEKQLLLEWNCLMQQYETNLIKIKDEDNATNLDAYKNYLKTIVGLANVAMRIANYLGQLENYHAEFSSHIASILHLNLSPTLKAQTLLFKSQLDAIATAINGLQKGLADCRNQILYYMRTDYCAHIIANTTINNTTGTGSLDKLLEKEELDYILDWCSVWVNTAQQGLPLTVELIDVANQRVIDEGFEPELIALETCNKPFLIA